MDEKPRWFSNCHVPRLVPRGPCRGFTAAGKRTPRRRSSGRDTRGQGLRRAQRERRGLDCGHRKTTVRQAAGHRSGQSTGHECEAQALLVAEPQRIVKIDRAGKVEVFADANAFPAEVKSLTALAIDPAGGPKGGTVFVCDGGDSQGKGGEQSIAFRRTRRSASS